MGAQYSFEGPEFNRSIRIVTVHRVTILCAQAHERPREAILSRPPAPLRIHGDDPTRTATGLGDQGIDRIAVA